MTTGGTRPRRRVTAARLLREFHEGRSVLGLARKYARTRRQIEAAIRRVAVFPGVTR